MEQLLPDDILESLCKLRIRASEKLKTVLELHNFETHQQKAKLDHHRLKTMVKRSIEHELRSRNFEARHGRIESNILVKIQREQRRVHKGQGECWQWQANGQCTKGDQCSFRHDRNKRAKAATQPTPSPEHTTQAQGGKNLAISKSPRGRSPSGKISRQPCKEHLQGTCTNPSCEEWHSLECLLHKTVTGCKFGDKCVFASRRVEEEPSKRSKKNCEKCSSYGERDKEFGLCIPGHGAAEVFIDFTEELNHAETKPKCTIHKNHTALNQSSRLKSIAQQNLPRRTSSANPERSKIWGLVSGRDRMTRALGSRSSVEAGQKCVKIKGASKSSILLTFGE